MTDTVETHAVPTPTFHTQALPEPILPGSALRGPALARPTLRRRRGKTRAYRIFRVVILTLVVLLFIAPLVWMLVASFKTNVDIYDSHKTFFFTPTLENYANVLARNNYFVFIFNSLS